MRNGERSIGNRKSEMVNDERENGNGDCGIKMKIYSGSQCGVNFFSGNYLFFFNPSNKKDQSGEEAGFV